MVAHAAHRLKQVCCVHYLSGCAKKGVRSFFRKAQVSVSDNVIKQFVVINTFESKLHFIHLLATQEKSVPVNQKSLVC